MLNEIQAHLIEYLSTCSFNFFDGRSKAICPYGTFGELSTSRLRTKTSNGKTLRLQLDLFSDDNGQYEIKKMLEEVENAIPESFIVDVDGLNVDVDEPNLQVDDSNLQKVSTRLHVDVTEFDTQIIKEVYDEKLTYHGVVDMTLKYY